MSQEKRERREEARAAASERDEIEFLSTQDGKAIAAAAETDAPETIAARKRVGAQFMAFIGDAPFSVDALKLFIRTDCESYAATTMWTRRSHLLKFLTEEFWVRIPEGALAATDALLSAKQKKHTTTKASVFSIDEVLRYLRTAPETSLHLRHKLVLLFGVFSLGRMKEVVGLTWEDIAQDDAKAAYICTIKRCKTDRDSSVQRFFLPYMFYDVDTRTLLEAYRAAAGTQTGPLWTRAGTQVPLGKTTLAETPKLVAAFLKLPNPERYTGHGLRATGATAMADHGATELELMTAGNWKSAAVARGYIRQSLAAGTRRASLIMGTPAQPGQLAPAPPAPTPAPPALAPSTEEPPKKLPKVDVPSTDFIHTIFSNCVIQGPITINLK